MMKPIATFLLFTTCTLSHAWVCPNNFSQIAVGDTIEQIASVCGKPASEKKSEGGYQGPQEWQYFVSINQPLNNSGASPGSNPTVKMSVAFIKNKVINITVQGQSVASTSLCGPTINVGSSDKSVKKLRQTYFHTKTR